MPRPVRAWLALGAIAPALLLAGCGFTPIYADAGAVGSLRRVAVTAPDNRLGYRLREQLEDALAVDLGAAPAWRLVVEAEQSRRPLGRRIDDTATRYELTVEAAWTLTPVAGGEPLSGAVTSTTTYEAADQPYAAIAAQQDGEERAAADVARLVRLDLMRRLAE